MRWLPSHHGDWQKIIILGSVALVYLALFFRVLLPRYPGKNWLQWVNFTSITLFLLLTGYLTGLRSELYILYVLIAAVAGIRLGLTAAVTFALLASVGSLLIILLTAQMTAYAIISGIFQLVVYYMAGYISSILAKTMQRQSEETDQRNRNLALLLEMSTVSDTLDLESSMPRLAERIVRGLSSSFCSIHLLDPATGELVTYGYYPARARAAIPGTRRHPLAHLAWHQKAIDNQQIAVIRQDLPSLKMNDGERDAMLFPTMQSACLVPLVFEKKALGVISVGEERKWEREPIDQAKFEMLVTIAAQTAVVINNFHLHQATRRQVERMAVINEVTRAISSTIEMDNLLELIYQQINRVVSAETYFVGLYEPREEEIDLRIIIDDGERFPSKRIPLGNGLSSYVIRENKPLLARQISAEREALPANVVLMGKPRESESWLGVPITSGGVVTGILAVASYHPHAFDEDDVALLMNVAGQAAMALDNARHHAEVEEQSRRDSLTGIYNHSYFLTRLHQEINAARELGAPVSMIMLDIDHFKKYNDTYGHVTGDQVLQLVVYSINSNINPTDLAGRWGGEEFGIVLPGRTAKEAWGVAMRIRRTLDSLPVFDNTGNGVPAPTISQGIASFPAHAASASQLVDVADRALYQAKDKGRDQIQVAGKF